MGLHVWHLWLRSQANHSSFHPIFFLPRLLLLSQLLSSCSLISSPHQWFLEKLGHEGLNNLLLAYPDKRAYAQCVVAYCEGPGCEIKVQWLIEREGRREGRMEGKAVCMELGVQNRAIEVLGQSQIMHGRRAE
jgi:hypothetical protein